MVLAPCDQRLFGAWNREGRNELGFGLCQPGIFARLAPRLDKTVTAETAGVPLSTLARGERLAGLIPIDESERG